MKKPAALLWLATIVAVGSCEPEKASHLDPVRIVVRPNLSTGAIYIADEEGFFKDEGIDLIFAEAPGRSVQALPLLERGNLDVVSATVSAGLFAPARSGSRLRFVADRGHIGTTGCEYEAIVGRGDLFKVDSPSAAEIRGKKISVGVAVTAEFIIDKFLAARGLTSGDLEAVALAEQLEAPAMRAKNIDLTHASGAYLTQMQADSQRIIGRGSQYAPGAHFGILIYGPTLTVTNRALGDRFMKAYLRGVRQYALGATPRNVEILAKRIKFEPELLRKSCFASNDTDGKLNTAWLIEFQKWAVARKYIDAVAPIGDIVDATFAQKASQGLNAAQH